MNGVYLLRKPRGKGEGTIVLQESAAAYAFIEEALPLLDKDGIDLWIYYVSSAELFDLLPAAKQHTLFPEERAREAMGITGFTLPTMFRWVKSDFGLSMTLHPFRKGHFLGSGQGEVVLAEAGLDGRSQYKSHQEVRGGPPAHEEAGAEGGPRCDSSRRAPEGSAEGKSSQAALGRSQLHRLKADLFNKAREGSPDPSRAPFPGQDRSRRRPPTIRGWARSAFQSPTLPFLKAAGHIPFRVQVLYQISSNPFPGVPKPENNLTHNATSPSCASNTMRPSAIFCSVSAYRACSCFSTRSASESAVSPGSTGTWHWAMIGPVS